MIDRIGTWGVVRAVTALAVVCVVGETWGGELEIAPKQVASPPNCVTSECHATLKAHKNVHQPVRANRCDFCHVPREGATPYLPGANHAFERAADNAKLCYTCHDQLADEAHVHEPVKMGLCILCHDPHGSERRSLLRVGTDRELCVQCHRETIKHHEDRVHGPVQIGACGACHDPHQSATRFRLRGEGAQQCVTCHQAKLRQFAGAAHIHKPVAENCSNCHEPHKSPNPFRLTNQDPRLCLDCHANIDNQVVHGTTIHKPITDGKCGDCHEHHGADFRRLLRGDFTPEPYEPFDLSHFRVCYRCHQESQVMEPLTTDATNFRNGEVNLHFKHVHKDEKGRTCIMCHEIHASTNPRLIARKIPFGTWQIPLSYQKTETGGSCLTGCHRKRGYDRINPVLNR